MKLGKRLGDAPHDVLKHVLGKQPKGHAVEFGTGNGVTLRLIAEVMPVVSFGSRHGLPEDWRPGFPRGRFAYDPPIVPNAEVVEGLFDETLPGYNFGQLGYIGLVHFDADLLSSTRTALRYIGPYLQAGTVCVFDEFHGYPGAGPNVGEWRAWREFVLRTGIEHEPVGHGPEQWATRIV